MADVPTGNHGINGYSSNKVCCSVLIQAVMSINTRQRPIPRFGYQVKGIPPDKQGLTVITRIRESDIDLARSLNLPFFKRVRLSDDVYDVAVFGLFPRGIVENL